MRTRTELKPQMQARRHVAFPGANAPWSRTFLYTTKLKFYVIIFHVPWCVQSNAPAGKYQCYSLALLYDAPPYNKPNQRNEPEFISSLNMVNFSTINLYIVQLNPNVQGYLKGLPRVNLLQK